MGSCCVVHGMSEQDREDCPPEPLSEFSPGGSAVVVPQHPQSKIASPPVIDVAKVNPWTVVPIYEEAADCQDEYPQAANVGPKLSPAHACGNRSIHSRSQQDRSCFVRCTGLCLISCDGK